MLKQTKPDPREQFELLGELHPLLEQLGTADGLFTLRAAAASLRLGQVTDENGLASFLDQYTTHLLVGLEWPTIYRAYTHAARRECREIVALDQALREAPIWDGFAAASRRVGQSWIKRLRPLRDERVVQRYLQAVEHGRAHGWHTIVFGITLCMYSVPVRQGLLDYGRQTLQGFLSSASAPLRLSRDQSDRLLARLCGGLPAHLEKIVTDDKANPFARSKEPGIFRR